MHTKDNFRNLLHQPWYSSGATTATVAKAEYSSTTVVWARPWFKWDLMCGKPHLPSTIHYMSVEGLTHKTNALKLQLMSKNNMEDLNKIESKCIVMLHRT
uniref:Uncharacterized protein n=1 Tax=Nothobranchius furzeri TaxID=105023 RepID=A0A1A8V4E4_NOTFU